jgi:hypothetical protein
VSEGSEGDAGARRAQLDPSLQSRSKPTSGSGIRSASDYPLPLPPLSAVGGSAEAASAARLQLPNLNMGNVLAAHLQMVMSSTMDVKDVAAASSPVLEVGGGEVSVPSPPSASHGLCRHQESDLDDSGRT